MTPAPSAEADIHCEGLVRIFTVADIEVQALQGLDLFVGRGELVALVGASGSGKSTLLAILSGLDTPTAGKAVVAGRDLPSLTNRDRVAYRRDVVGFVWQQTARNLLPYLSALENVELAAAIGRKPRAKERALRMLDLVGAAHLAGRHPAELSGGQQQRVAVARALANDPAVILADEPTGNLDLRTGTEIIELLKEMNESAGVTVISATHDHKMLSVSDRVVWIADGRIDHIALREDLEIEVTQVEGE